MVCLGLEPGAAGWKAQTNPLSYGGTPSFETLPASGSACVPDIFHVWRLVVPTYLPTYLPVNATLWQANYLTKFSSVLKPTRRRQHHQQQKRLFRRWMKPKSGSHEEKEEENESKNFFLFVFVFLCLQIFRSQCKSLTSWKLKQSKQFRRLKMLAIGGGIGVF